MVPAPEEPVGAEPSLTRLGSSSSALNFGECGVRELRCRRNIFPDSIGPVSDFFVSVCLRGIVTSREGSLDAANVAGGAAASFDVGCGLAGERSRVKDAEVGRKRS